MELADNTGASTSCGRGKPLVKAIFNEHVKKTKTNAQIKLDFWQ
jgi:NAD(P)H-nitrite reductase large subunit